MAGFSLEMKWELGRRFRRWDLLGYTKRNGLFLSFALLHLSLIEKTRY